MNHRLLEHDYSGRGYYFITATVYQRRAIFSTITDYKTTLTPLGGIVAREWLRLHKKQPILELQEFEVIPDHFHGSIITTAQLPKPLSYYIGNFKGRARQAIRKLIGKTEFPARSKGHFDIVSPDADMFHALRHYNNGLARLIAAKRP